MPITINFSATIEDADVAKILAGLGVKANPTISDPTPGTAAADPAKATKTKAPKAAKAAEPEPAPEAQTDDQGAITDEQFDAVKDSAAAASKEDMVSNLTDFFQARGLSAKEASATISDLDDDALRSEYADYLARLWVDEKGDFTPDFTTAYIANRTFDDKIVKKWVKGGITMTDEEVTAEGLADPEAPAPAAPVRRALPKRGK